MSDRRARGAAPRLDAANLAGITKLMNPQHLKPDADLEGAEKRVMGRSAGAGRGKAEVDPVRLYTLELGQLAEELGLDLLDDDAGAAPKPAAHGGRAGTHGGRAGAHDPPQRSSPQPPPLPRSAPGPARSRIDDLIDDLDLGLSAPKGKRPAAAAAAADCNCGDACTTSCPCPCHASGEECDCDEDCPDDCSCACHEEESCDCDEDCPDDCSCACHESGEEDESCDCDEDCPDDCSCACHEEGEDEGGAAGTGDDKVDSIISRLESELGIQTDGGRDRRHRLRDTAVPIVDRERGERRRGGGDRFTDEQERRRHINSVVSDLRGETRTTHGTEWERAQDMKARKLEQIGQLRMTLEEEGIDCSAVTTPTARSSPEEIDSVLNILHLKNARNRYCSLAEEVIIGAAEAVEMVLDGTREIPILGWKPDYTGWHNTVAVKLHRMRFETAQCVERIVTQYNIGPWSRVAMELLPSFFLYPRQQRKQRGAPGLAGDPHVADARGAYAGIRAADAPKSLQDARGL